MLVNDRTPAAIEFLQFIYECNRYFFFARVHLSNSRIYPDKTEGDLISFIERILNVES